MGLMDSVNPGRELSTKQKLRIQGQIPREHGVKREATLVQLPSSSSAQTVPSVGSLANKEVGSSARYKSLGHLPH